MSILYSGLGPFHHDAVPGLASFALTNRNPYRTMLWKSVCGIALSSLVVLTKPQSGISNPKKRVAKLKILRLAKNCWTSQTNALAHYSGEEANRDSRKNMAVFFALLYATVSEPKLKFFFGNLSNSSIFMVHIFIIFYQYQVFMCHFTAKIFLFYCEQFSKFGSQGSNFVILKTQVFGIPISLSSSRLQSNDDLIQLQVFEGRSERGSLSTDLRLFLIRFYVSYLRLPMQQSSKAFCNIAKVSAQIFSRLIQNLILIRWSRLSVIFSDNKVR